MARNCLKHRVATSPGLKHTVTIGASGGIGAALVLKHALRLSPSDPPRQSSCKRGVMAQPRLQHGPRSVLGQG
ncbi:hypothetical protein [Primorskyibacter flagellatus]|uniref:hypothetical protein n=1 Tax=Primorskyibacter flagellatus TaxID=1387277 RepID=UPI001179E2A9|nr:hypothetical protein [Primorskyibacter flagellatus]